MTAQESTENQENIELKEENMQEEAQSSCSCKEALEQEIASLKDFLLRERAENENLRKRQERELSNAYKYASEKLIKDLLPVLDSLTLGLKAADEMENVPDELKQFLDGSQMTLKIFMDTLIRHGVEEIDPLGEKLDPEKHEAVAIIPVPDATPNTITHVAQKGYVLNGRTIRAAQVVVAKGE